MEEKFFSFGPEFKFLDGDADKKIGTIEGYGAIFGNKDDTGDIIAPGAFTETLRKNGLPVMLLQHKSDRVVGIWTSAVEDERGLFLKGELNLDVQDARETYSLLKQKALKGLSIGYRVRDYSIDQKTYTRTLKSVDLLEVSLVTFPANDKAKISGVKAMPETERELEDALRGIGFGRTQAKALISGGFKALKSLQRDVDDKVKAEIVRRDADGLETVNLMKNILATLKG